jgi:hypothetical protein
MVSLPLEQRSVIRLGFSGHQTLDFVPQHASLDRARLGLFHRQPVIVCAERDFVMRHKTQAAGVPVQLENHGCFFTQKTVSALAIFAQNRFQALNDLCWCHMAAMSRHEFVNSGYTGKTSNQIG